MKQLLLVISLFLTTSVWGQNGNVKVKKEKNEKVSIAAKAGVSSISIKSWDCDPGTFIGGYCCYNALFKPKRPECHWGFDVGIGMTYYSGKANWDDSYKKSASEEDLNIISIATIPVDLKYFLNPLSTRGKWLLKAGMEVCPLIVGVPSTEQSKTLSQYVHLSNDAIGCGLNLDASLGYESKHWGISVGGYIGFMAPYSDDPETSSDTPSLSGYYVGIQYLF